MQTVSDFMDDVKRWFSGKPHKTEQKEESWDMFPPVFVSAGQAG